MNLLHSTTERGSGVFTTKAYILQKHQDPLNANLEQQYSIWVLKNSMRESPGDEKVKTANGNLA